MKDLLNPKKYKIGVYLNELPLFFLKTKKK